MAHMSEDAEFRKRLLTAFRAEANEHIQAITSAILDLEKSGAAKDMERTFREAHTLKGAARAVGLVAVESVCQELERIFSDLRRTPTQLSAQACDLLLQSLDYISSVIGSPSDHAAADPKLIQRLSELFSNNSDKGNLTIPDAGTGAQTQHPAPEIILPETIRVKAESLNSVLLIAEELFPATHGINEQQTDLEAIDTILWETIVELKSKSSAGSSNLPLEKVVELHNVLEKIHKQIGQVRASSAIHTKQLREVVGRLFEQAKDFLMIPAAALFEPFPRMVRDLAQQAGKDVYFETRGGALQIDRSILPNLHDMLLHLIRNAVDHGIELPDERKRLGKPEHGKVCISLENVEPGWITISVSDDGQGIDLQKLKESAEHLGISVDSGNDDATANQVVNLVFISGLTTAGAVTTISGRGLGMAIVREKAFRLGGTVSIRTESGQGATFSLRVPLVRSIFRGVRVQAGGQEFIIAARHIDQIVRVSSADKISIDGQNAIYFRGKPITIVPLAHALGLNQGQEDDDHLQKPALIVSTGERSAALMVDSIEEEAEIVSKDPGPYLRHAKKIEAVTVLSSGRAVPVLNIPEIMGDLSKFAQTPVSSTPQQAADRKTAGPFHVLVVDDSITSRMLLKNVLEGAGYLVRTTMDGQEGWIAVHEQPFDAVVTDLEMPVMNGFELTKRIRADVALREMPIILVTALGSREDRERGMEAGANAYIVKGNFNQSDLLGHLGRILHSRQNRQ
jgi:two-component system, chemotaxis family, sensor kinase CheA